MPAIARFYYNKNNRSFKIDKMLDTFATILINLEKG